MLGLLVCTTTYISIKFLTLNIIEIDCTRHKIFHIIFSLLPRKKPTKNGGREKKLKRKELKMTRVSKAIHK
jgi:hypothetical protein